MILLFKGVVEEVIHIGTVEQEKIEITKVTIKII